MREFFTDKNFIRSKLLVLAKIVLAATLVIFFLPLLILPFFNHPFADDYFCGYYLAEKGFVNYQSFIYTKWGGRFAATFTGSLFAYKNFLYSHYYLHPFLLLVLNFLSVFLLVHTFHKHVLKADNSFSKKLLICFLFLALEICSLPEPSTFLFWFSSAITYQLPLILFQAQIALLTICLYSDKKAFRSVCTIVVPMMVFITVGLNELFIVVQLLLFVIAFYFRKEKKISAVFAMLMLIAFAAGSAILLTAPGNKIRMHGIDAKTIPVAIVAVAYHSSETLWSIFKNPLFFFLAVAVFMYAAKTRKKWQADAIIKISAQNKLLFAAGIFIFILLAVSVPVIAFKGGVIPNRYVNAVVCIVVLLLMTFFFMTGSSINTNRLPFTSHTRKLLLHGFLIAGLLCNTYIVDAYKSLIIAPVYNNILNKREAVLKHAAQNGKIPVVKDYNAAMAELIKNRYSNATTTFKQIIQQKPPLLFFEDDLETNLSIEVVKNYYRLDSIIVEHH